MVRQLQPRAADAARLGVPGAGGAPGAVAEVPGRLLATARGRGLREDPVALWWHLARSVPPRAADAPRGHAGLLLLAAIAGQVKGDPHEYVAGMLWRAGWARRDGTELDRWDARAAAWETYVVLVRLGALVPDWHGSGPGRPAADGAVFARAALRTWPSAS